MSKFATDIDTLPSASEARERVNMIDTALAAAQATEVASIIKEAIAVGESRATRRGKLLTPVEEALEAKGYRCQTITDTEGEDDYWWEVSW